MSPCGFPATHMRANVQRTVLDLLSNSRSRRHLESILSRTFDSLNHDDGNRAFRGVRSTISRPRPKKPATLNAKRSVVRPRAASVPGLILKSQP